MKRLPIILLMAFSCQPLFSQWTTLTSGTTNWLRGVWFTSADTGYVVGYSGTILKTTNGTTWSAQTSGTTNNLMSVFFVDANTGYACGVSGCILKTVNAGVNWLPLTSGTGATLHEVFFVDPNNGYIAGEVGTCLKTTNGGMNWSPLSLATGNGKVSLFFNDVNTGYVVGAGLSDAIQKTVNAGTNWTDVHSNTPEELSSICFTDYNNGYTVSTITGNILRTTNAGVTWTAQAGNGDALYAVKFPSQNTGYIVGGFPSTGTVLKTSDAGTTWSQQNSGTTSPLFDVCFLNDSLGYAVGRYGTIIKTLNGGTGFNEMNAHPIVLSAYPNPASSEITIDGIEPGESMNLRLIDITGRVVMEKMMEATDNRVDVSGLPNGTYIAFVGDEKSAWSGKVVIQH